LAPERCYTQQSAQHESKKIERERNDRMKKRKCIFNFSFCCFYNNDEWIWIYENKSKQENIKEKIKNVKGNETILDTLTIERERKELNKDDIS